LNFVLNWLLIPRFSWQGAAAASLASDGALAAMNWLAVIWLMRRQERLRSTLMQPAEDLGR
jgi:O-antigen/teichoic acid export membrane protein